MENYNKLLPKISELKPITDCNNTFYHCGFNSEFNSLNFQSKLQIICDIVRQSIFPNPYPNPNNDIEQMNGDCYTACKVFKAYIEELNIGDTCKIVFAFDRPFVNMDKPSRHNVIIVEKNNQKYLVDPTPYVGYNYGEVIDLSIYNPYNYYIELKSDVDKLLQQIQKIRYLDSINMINLDNLELYYKILSESLKFNEMRGYSISLIKILNKYVNDNEKNKLNKLVITIDKYDKLNYEQYIKYEKKILGQISKWEEELNDLVKDDNTAKRQLRLAQNIVTEYKFLNQTYERYSNLLGKNYRKSFINPRVLYEYGLNEIMIKPSAYFINVDNTIRNGFINYFGSPIGEYKIDLSQNTVQTGIKPMIFSHPSGTDYIRSMIGTSDIILLKGNVDDIYRLKKYYRNQLCNDLWYRNIIWSDGNLIEWHPFVTNLVHSADNYPEASLHYNIGYPEHQNMTRFMYPNPRLCKELKK